MDSLGSHSSATIGSERSVSMDDTCTSSDASKGDKGKEVETSTWVSPNSVKKKKRKEARRRREAEGL
ncbi:hypothetical protein OIU77_013039 [Salix suchowensis]|uniref:Uncharacterized protein n=1 Tax=Salix suchowensis TaxID=1278906 RepID=A0ABQ8ZT62_9ROSI|nr:hypothetical protein OIU77_013039 [Salix suchowensis]